VKELQLAATTLQSRAIKLESAGSALKQLDFKHLAIEIQTAGGAKGALFHRLVFTNAPGTGVMDVLSEGESRTLSLAAFMRRPMSGWPTARNPIG
jgi:hypothetical protein